MLQQLTAVFEKEYSKKPSLTIQAPGRINLIGEHTDYNMGLVFPAAIDKRMYFAFEPNKSNEINLFAYDKDSKVNLILSDLSSDKLWANYCIGIINEFQNLGIETIGFDALFMSDIPIGAGVSSSAALECGFSQGLNVLNKAGLKDWDLVHLGNRAENNHLGIKSGILDQFASIFGRQDQAMLMDCRDQSFEYFDIDLDPYQLVLINTNVKHSHLSSGYNDRPTECAKVLEIAKKKFSKLGDLSELTKNKLSQLADQISPTLYNRANFLIEENERVLKFKEALRLKNFEVLGMLFYSTHEGLKTEYEVSCKELDLLVDLSKKHHSILGARMMGGGFGGCTLNLIHKKGKEKTIDQICKDYKDQTDIEASPYYIEVGQGVKVLENNL